MMKRYMVVFVARSELWGGSPLHKWLNESCRPLINNFEWLNPRGGGLPPETDGWPVVGTALSNEYPPLEPTRYAEVLFVIENT